MAAGGSTARGIQGIKRFGVRGTQCVNPKLRCVAAVKSQSSLVKSVRARKSYSVCVHGTSTTQFNSGAGGLQICVSIRTPAVIEGRRLNILKSQKKQGGALTAESNAAKTRKSVAKRFRMTGSGKIVYKSSTKAHNLSVKSGRRKRRLSHMKKVRLANMKGLLKNVPAFRKHGKALKADRGHGAQEAKTEFVNNCEASLS